MAKKLFGVITPQGTPGPRGPQGIQGPVGYVFTPSVDEDGDLSWTNNGGLPNPETVNIKGPQGEPGGVIEAGENIIIEGNVISAIDTTYTAGTGISISEQNVISNTQTSAEWGNITGTLADQTDLNTALSGKQDTIDSSHKLSTDNISGLSTVATSGSYDDLLNKPTIPAAQVNSDWNANSGVAQILNKPTIPAAQVNSDWNASSGVAQILNKPTIPAAQVNSDWNSNSGVSQILHKPTIPTNTSDLNNDSGFITAGIFSYDADTGILYIDTTN